MNVTLCQSSLPKFSLSVASKRSHEDQAAHAWREGRSIVTFDFDFFDPAKPPQTRNPGVIVIDCDRSKQRDVDRAVNAIAEFSIAGGTYLPRLRHTTEEFKGGQADPDRSPSARRSNSRPRQRVPPSVRGRRDPDDPPARARSPECLATDDRTPRRPAETSGASGHGMFAHARSEAIRSTLAIVESIFGLQIVRMVSAISF